MKCRSHWYNPGHDDLREPSSTPKVGTAGDPLESTTNQDEFSTVFLQEHFSSFTLYSARMVERTAKCSCRNTRSVLNSCLDRRSLPCAGASPKKCSCRNTTTEILAARVIACLAIRSPSYQSMIVDALGLLNTHSVYFFRART
jgi:hypothetical protein